MAPSSSHLGRTWFVTGCSSGLGRALCERVLVLYLGRRMELAPTARLFASPRHPYSRELLAAIPIADPGLA